MPNTTRQELLRYWKQANNDLDRFLENLHHIDGMFEDANKDYPGKYDQFSGALAGFANLIIKIQENWQAFRDKKL